MEWYERTSAENRFERIGRSYTEQLHIFDANNPYEEAFWYMRTPDLAAAPES